MSDYYLDAVSRVADLPLFAQPAPSVRGSQTSAAAADSLGPDTLNRLHRLVLAWLEQHGPATDEEIAGGLQLNPSTARPRRIELARRGLVIEAGEKKTRSGRKATAWQATAASRGLAELQGGAHG